MQNRCILGIVGVFLFLGGCASSSGNTTNIDEQIDLYLSTLDDKHFVWCELDLGQCRKDFEKWKLTSRGRTLIREYEKEASGQTFNTHQVPNVFRTRFVDDGQLAEVIEEQNEKSEIGLDATPIIPRIYGPVFPD